jgi:hypothetical protein
MITTLAIVWWFLWIGSLTTRRLLVHAIFIFYTIILIGSVAAMMIMSMLTE